MIHCAPVADSDRSFCNSGIASATIVWSMNIIATAKIIAMSTRRLSRAPWVGSSAGKVRTSGRGPDVRVRQAWATSGCGASARAAGSPRGTTITGHGA